mmetsp:Transcript_20219/g.51668  ORF Transcript_20219/g.51668 Transcript_20219/m.51668 type:complete len:222 (+) Transcript_20219:2765-3430(+)
MQIRRHGEGRYAVVPLPQYGRRHLTARLVAAPVTLWQVSLQIGRRKTNVTLTAIHSRTHIEAAAYFALRIAVACLRHVMHLPGLFRCEYSTFLQLDHIKVGEKATNERCDQRSRTTQPCLCYAAVSVLCGRAKGRKRRKSRGRELESLLLECVLLRVEVVVSSNGHLHYAPFARRLHPLHSDRMLNDGKGYAKGALHIRVLSLHADLLNRGAVWLCWIVCV